MHAVRPGLGYDVDDAAAGAAEVDAKVAGLCRHLLNGVGNVEGLRDAVELDVIVLGAVQQIVISARSLTVHGELRCLQICMQTTSPQSTARRLDDARQRAR